MLTGQAASVPRSAVLGSYVLGAYGLGYLELFTFVLALRCHELGLSVDKVGLVMGAGSLGSALLAIPIGSLIDRYGPRRSFLFTAIATAVLSLAFALVGHLLLLVALQFVMGCARTTAWVSSQGYVTGIGTEAERPSHAGRFGFFVGAGQMLTALLAGAVTQFAGVRAGFVLGAVYSILFVVIAARLPELAPASRPSAPSGSFGQAVRLLRIPGVQTAMLLTFTRLWVVTAWTAFVPLILVTSGLAPGLVGFVIAAKGCVITLSSLSAGRLARRLGVITLGLVSLSLGAVGLGLSPWLNGPVSAFLPAALVGLAMGLSLPVILATLTDGAAHDHRALALSMRESANSTASTLGPPVVGRLMTFAGIRTGFLITTGTCLGLLGLAAIRSRRPAEPPLST